FADKAPNVPPAACWLMPLSASDASFLSAAFSSLRLSHELATPSVVIEVPLDEMTPASVAMPDRAAKSGIGDTGRKRLQNGARGHGKQITWRPSSNSQTGRTSQAQQRT